VLGEAAQGVDEDVGEGGLFAAAVMGGGEVSERRRRESGERA